MYLWLNASSGRAFPLDTHVPQLLADEHGAFIGSALMIADLAGLAGVPRNATGSWPHWRDQRIREQSRLA